MSNIISKFLLFFDKIIPQMHLEQPRFVYSTRQLFTKTFIGDIEDIGDIEGFRYILDIYFTKMNQIKHVFSMTWFSMW